MRGGGVNRRVLSRGSTTTTRAHISCRLTRKIKRTLVVDGVRKQPIQTRKVAGVIQRDIGLDVGRVEQAKHLHPGADQRIGKVGEKERGPRATPLQKGRGGASRKLPPSYRPCHPQAMRLPIPLLVAQRRVGLNLRHVFAQSVGNPQRSAARASRGRGGG